MDPWLPNASKLLAVPLLVLLNGYFVAAEFALVSVRRTRVNEMVKQNRFGARELEWSVTHLDDALAAAQVGITFASLVLGWVGEPVLVQLIDPLFHGLGHWSMPVKHAVAVTIAFLAITYFHIVLGEQVPKVLAIRRAEDIALLVATPLFWFARVSTPFLLLISRSSAGVIRLLRLPTMPPGRLVHSIDELRQLVEETQKAGVIAEDQASYVKNLFRLSDKRVADVMVPREKVIAISLAAKPDEVLATARETAHTRLPVFDGDPDNIVGIVNTKDLFHLFSLEGLVILDDAMYPPLFASPHQSVGGVLQLFKREKRPMAVVRDAKGSFLGIVTLEDILEEIVGEIEDEHDDPRWEEE
jgi:CBS domain containing-hemolysin-like protein